MSISKPYFEDELKKINSNDTKPLDVLFPEVIQNEIYAVQESMLGGMWERNAGAYTFTVPAYVYEIQITACSGGEGGGGDNDAVGASGGFGGKAINAATYTVTPKSDISMTIGKGGTGGQRDAAGNKGEPTVIDGIVTVAGDGASGGAYEENGTDGIIGKGGISDTDHGGGGGGSLGNGGNGGTPYAKAANGVMGGGGGGGFYGDIGGDGGDGYVKITWGGKMV